MELLLLVVVGVGAIVLVAGFIVAILAWLILGRTQVRHREAPHEAAAPTTDETSRGWLKEAIEEASPPAAATAPYSPGFTPLSPQELAAHFPHLEILELLGKGGMGAVYKARQPHLDRLVALKVLPPDAARDSAFAERFAREARALARLNHPHIVTVHDFGESGGLFFLLMEFVDGVNLRQAMRSGALTPQESLRIVPQLCEALQFAHDEGVVHRDIKPENILLDKRGRVKVADFGLAKLLGQTAGDANLTGTLHVMGTMNYMAPEQLAGARAVDHRADIYSLGVTFYEMLTRELPLGNFPPPSKTAGIDARLDHVVLRTLEREPANRYQHASDVKTEVESIARDPAGDTVALRPGLPIWTTTPPGYIRWVGFPILLLTGVYLPVACGLLAFTQLVPNPDVQVTWLAIGVLLCAGPILLALTFLVLNLVWLIWGPRRPAQPPEDSGVSPPLTGEMRDSGTKLPEAVQMKIRRAGNWLLATGIVVMLSWIPVTLLVVAIAHMDGQWRPLEDIFQPLLQVQAAWSLLAGAVITRGGMEMRRLRGYGWAKLGCILAMVPLSAGVVLGLAIGIWVLSMLCRREVQDEFQRAKWLGKNRAFESSTGSGPADGARETSSHALGWIIGRAIHFGRGGSLLWAAFCLGAYLALWLPRYGVVDRWFWPNHGIAESTVSLQPANPAPDQPALYRRLLITERIEVRRFGRALSDADWSGNGPRGERTRHEFLVQIDLNNGEQRKLAIDALDGMSWYRPDRPPGPRASGALLDFPTALAWMHEGMKIKQNDEPPEELRQQSRFWVDLVRQAANRDTVPRFFAGKPTVGRLDGLVWDLRGRWINDKQSLPFHDGDWVGTEKAFFGPVVSILWVGAPLMLVVWGLGFWLLRRRRGEARNAPGGAASRP